MRPITRTRVVVILAMTIATGSAALSTAAEETADNVLDAITKGTFSLNLRYRYADVDEGGFYDRGKASTLRTMAGYRTRSWKGLEVYLEFEDIHNLGLSNDHNNAGAGSLWNGVTDRPVIPDPALTEVNQASLGWRPLESLSFRFGLQEIVIGNSRFVGNVGWRQNHQSFEAARIAFVGVEDLEIHYSYIGRQHTVNGASLPMSTSHLGAAYRFDAIGTLKAYALLLDYERQAQWDLSTTTFGGFFDGKARLSDRLGLKYRLEYARQQDAGDNPDHISTDYGRADLGLSISKVTIAAGYEVLGGSPDDGQFRTPLATLHKFNGWADKFLDTPTNGLKDLFLSVTVGLGAWKAMPSTTTFRPTTAEPSGERRSMPP